MCVSSRVLCEGWWCHAIVKSWGQMESLNPERRHCRIWGDVIENHRDRGGINLSYLLWKFPWPLYASNICTNCTNHWIILDNSKLIIVFYILALIMSSLVPEWISLSRTANFMIKIIALPNALSPESSSSLSSSRCWWGRWESFTPGLGLRRLHHSLHTTTAQNRTLTIWWGRFLLRLW